MITAQQFSQTFEQVSRKQIIPLLQCWPSQPDFTRYVKHQMMPAIAGALGCSVALEYKRIDIVFRALPSPEDETVGDAKIIAAIEHENNFGGAGAEVRKLRDLALPLGVLITYASVHRRPEMLAEFADILAVSDVSSGGVPESEILVIIGPYGMNAPTVLTWEYFVSRGGKFQKISL